MRFRIAVVYLCYFHPWVFPRVGSRYYIYPGHCTSQSMYSPIFVFFLRAPPRRFCDLSRNSTRRTAFSFPLLPVSRFPFSESLRPDFPSFFFQFPFDLPGSFLVFFVLFSAYCRLRLDFMFDRSSLFHKLKKNRFSDCFSLLYVTGSYTFCFVPASSA